MNRGDRRYATQQINQAYVVLLSSQFQRFCRDLHSEAIDHLTTDPLQNPRYDSARIRLTEARKLDNANPNPGNIGSDFARFGMQFWAAVVAMDALATQQDKLKLELLNLWRNAVAHQDFDPGRLGGPTQIRLTSVRQWRLLVQRPGSLI